MIKEVCDICGRELVNYTDMRGRRYAPICMRQKKAQKKITIFGETPWVYISICGRCQKALEYFTEEEDD